MRSAGLVLVLAAALAGAAGAQQDGGEALARDVEGERPAVEADYPRDVAEAERLLEDGQAGRARALLLVVVARWPQDFRAWMLLGDACLGAGDPDAAEAAFAHAERLSEGNPDARLGVAWALAHQGRHDEARLRFEELEEVRPDQARAGQAFLDAALLHAPGPWGLGATLAWTALAYPGHPALDGGAGLGLSLRGYAGWAAARATLRLTGLVLDESWTAVEALRGRGHRATLDEVPGLLSADLFLSAALGTSWGGASAHYHLGVDGGLGVEGVALRHTAGVVGRASLLGDAFAEASGSWYVDTWGVRGAASWRTPRWQGVYLEPGLAAQLVAGAPRASASILVGVEAARAGLWGSLRLGPEERPVSLRADLAYPFSDVILGGAAVGGHVAWPAAGHRLFVAGEVLLLSPSLAHTVVPSLASPFTASPAAFVQVGWTIDGP